MLYIADMCTQITFNDTTLIEGQKYFLATKTRTTFKPTSVLIEPENAGNSWNTLVKSASHSACDTPLGTGIWTSEYDSMEFKFSTSGEVTFSYYVTDGTNIAHCNETFPVLPGEYNVEYALLWK